MRFVMCSPARWVGLAAVTLLATTVAAQDEAVAPVDEGVSWVQSPATVSLGSEAEIELGEGYAFANAEDTKKLMQAMGNTVDDTEVGLVRPTSETDDWILVFEYNPVGYVKDDEKDKIDADALLASINEGTEEANKIRKERGIPGLHVERWAEKPNYDPVTHNLQWAILARTDDGRQLVNHNVRLLGRAGYMSVTLVEDPAKLAQSKPQMKQVLDGFSYKKGQTYAEWRPGDKVAQYGLAALVAGGAGAAAAKLGLFGVLAKLLSKMGKAVILLVIAALAGLKRLFEMLTNRAAGRTAE